MKKFFYALFITTALSILLSCDLFPKEEKDETTSMTEISFDQIKQDVENEAEWTKGDWLPTVSEFEKTERMEHETSINYPADTKMTIPGIYLTVILPVHDELEALENKTKYQSPVKMDEEKKQQYVDTLEGYKIYLDKKKDVMIIDIFSSRFDKKYLITTNIKDRYRLERDKK